MFLPFLLNAVASQSGVLHILTEKFSQGRKNFSGKPEA